MTDIASGDLDDFVLMLRSRTALGRLNDSEVRSVIAFLEDIGFAQASTPVEPAPLFAPLAPPPDVA